MANRQKVVKFKLDEKREQDFIREEIRELVAYSGGYVGRTDNYLWKIQARAEDKSVVTATLYTSGNLVLMGHGEIFCLTVRLVTCYHKPIPKP